MSYIYYNSNPAKKIAGDCVIRAVGLFRKQSWEDTYIDLCMYGLKVRDMPNANIVWSMYLVENGYTKQTIPNTCPVCYTIRDFCEDNPEGTFLLATGSHVVTVINGDYYDTWDSGDEIPTSYWYDEMGNDT